MKKLVSIRCLPLQIFVLAFIFCFVVTSLAYSSESKQAKKILIIHSDVPEMSYVKLIHKGIFDFFASDKGADVEYFIEYMEEGRYRTQEYETKLREMYSLKYSTNRPDLIITVSYQALKFITAYGRELFPGVPVVFTTIIDHELDELAIDNDLITGIYTEMGFGKLFETIQRLQPDLERIVVITGSSPYDIFWRKIIAEVFSAYKGDVEFEYLHDLSMDELKERISQYRKGTAVYYFMMLEDGAGNKYEPWKALTLFAPASGVPVFSSFDSYMGHGTVGGYQLSFELYGKLTAETAQRVLEGEAPSNIPIIKYTDWPCIFDWRELKRWNIDESDLPEGSIVRYKEWSFWYLYRGYIIGGFFIFLIQGFFILSLAVQRKRGKQREQRLRASEERYSAFVKNSTEGIFRIEFDTDIYLDMPEDEQFDLVFKHGYIAETNDVHARTFGLEHAEELEGVRIEELLSRSDPQNVASIKAWIRGHYNIIDAETVESYKDGSTRNILNNAVSVIEAGRVVRVWCTYTDITKRKQSQEQLIRAEERYRTVADFTYDWEYWQAPDGSLLYISPSCERITGYCVSEFIERPELISEIILPEDRAIWNGHDHNIKTRTESVPTHCHFRIKSKEGHIRWIGHICNAIIDDEGNYAGVRASNRDLTELRITEQKLRDHRDMLTHLDRRANLGQLAGSIAHELTQPLTGIMSDAQAGELLLKKGQVDQTQIEEIFADIVSDTKRASQVLRNLRELFGDHKYEFKHMNINALIEETLRILHSELISQGVTINTDLSAKLPNVNGNRVHLQQILINMIINSWQAMHQVAATDRWLSITTAFGDDGQVVVCLEDNGSGIDPGILDGIFEPLTTTKEAGLGMGLAISTTIVQAHGGRIWAENNPKGGTRFYFTLPIVEVIP